MEKTVKPAHMAIAFLLLVVLIGSWFFFSISSRGNAGNSTTGTYSAVFLANGQVYFGKLGAADRDYTVLTDIYYPQAQVQPAVDGQPGTNTAQEQPRVSLVKLGEEIQGPIDEIKINTSQILYTEELKENGPVVKKIRDSKK